MVTLALLLCIIALFSSNSAKYVDNGWGLCSLQCDDGTCIMKNDWCNGRYDCSDRSDENYCEHFSRILGFCKDDIHFKCDNGRCIPKQGYCDGYSSCSDQSDERNCPCEELLFEKKRNLQYEALLDSYRTHQKCWKISVTETEYLNMNIVATFKERDCIYGNVTIYSDDEFQRVDNLKNRFYVPGYENYYNDIRLLCPSQYTDSTYNRSFTFLKDVYIRYRSNYYDSSSGNFKDILNLTFQKIDKTCHHSDVFKCSEFSCISPEKKCDGNKDCKNGLDEENCDYGLNALTEAYLVPSRTNATHWMRNQHNADWGWKENTHKAIVALHFVDDANFNGSSKDDDLIAKQLELEVLTYLFRHKFDAKTSSTELAAYINALLVICHDPRNFYGFNLVATLKKDLETDSSFSPPFPYLTLCSAEEPIPEDAVVRLLRIVDSSAPNHGFLLELQALATMALICINNSGSPVQHLEQNITEAINNLKKQQMEDGSFGNEYTTALVLQALIANNQENSKDWNPKASIEFVSGKQHADGSFGDFLTTYLIMPVLNAKSLVDIGKINCTDSSKRPRGGNTVSDIKNRLGKKIVMKYSLFIGDEKDQIHPILLRTPANITVLELMTLAADLDPKYKFKTHEIKKTKFIYEISNIPNDPENNKFWFIYQGSNEDMKLTSEQSPEKIKTHEKDHIIMWYKTLDSL